MTKQYKGVAWWERCIGLSLLLHDMGGGDFRDVVKENWDLQQNDQDFNFTMTANADEIVIRIPNPEKDDGEEEKAALG